ncbi:hypothetical protein [Azospirillum agricola]|uniref:hypothetical protein n=1 Tax=Azospirillum agricola TaxID=1720247 RepID=UPI0015C4C254|nr:hypothetical protein [Azospirillum agricola]
MGAAPNLGRLFAAQPGMIGQPCGEGAGRRIRAVTRLTLRRKLLRDDDMGLQERAVG